MNESRGMLRSRDWGVVLASTVAGLIAGLVVTLVLPETFRASGAVILTRQGEAPGGDPALAQAIVAAEDLLRSRAVAVSAATNLKLSESPEALLDDVHVQGDPETSLIRIEVDAGSGENARRLAQELAEVFTVLYNGRFGPATTASIWETPRAEADPVSPNLGLDLVVGGMAGLILGGAVAALGGRAGRGARRVAPPSGPGAPRPVRARPSTPRRLASDRWSAVVLEDLERIAGSAPAPRSDWGPIIAALREFADLHGRLPRRLDPLLEEVFGSGIYRRESTPVRTRS